MHNMSCQTLMEMDYSSRGTYQVLLLSAKNRKQSLEFVQFHQNWRREDREMLPGLSFNWCLNIWMKG